MNLGSLLSWMVCGLIVGLIARILVPGRLSMGPLMTMGVGIVGAIVGGLLYGLVRGAPGDPWSFSGNAWQGWIVSIIGAVVVLWAYVSLYPRKWYQ